MISQLFALQLPVPGRELAQVTTYTPEVIRHFCTQVFREYLRRETGYRPDGGSELPSRKHQTPTDFPPRLPRGMARQGGR